jgi:hypothetical protein
LLAFFAAAPSAADRPWRAAGMEDLDGIWRQVGAVVIDPKIDRNDQWFTAKQFFRFPGDGGFKHVLVNPDSEPSRATPTQPQRFMLERAPAVQRLAWKKRGMAWLKHPERPPQRIEFGLYLRDASAGPDGGAIKPRKGDLVLVFYTYKDPNVPMYYKLLRRLP